MNFLAHAYLSYDSQGLLIGNFIGDSVKGSDYLKYEREIQQGIQLHRHIDQFTDHHPVVTRHLELLRRYFAKYAAVVSDIYFDHFLAIYWENYSTIPLKTYSASVYKIIEEKKDILPEKVMQFLPYMIQGDWLANYATMEGLQRVFAGMSRRANFISHMENATDVLQENYSTIDEIFREFFPHLETEVKRWIEKNSGQ